MRILKLVFALALSIGSGSAWASDGLTARFLSSDYTLCDARFVAKTFSFSQERAKSYIGEKIEWGTTDILDGDLNRARQRGLSDPAWRCRFHEGGYSYEDASALAAYWGVSTGEAKDRVEEKIHAGNERFFRKEVLSAAHRQAGHPVGTDRAPAVASKSDLEAFFDSGYDYCHAKMLVGTQFGASASEAKELIGYKVKNGWGDVVDSTLERVRKKHQAAETTPCTFGETRYTSADAAKLATLWGQSVQEVKSRVEQKYAWGSERLVADELKRATTGEGPRMGGRP